MVAPTAIVKNPAAAMRRCRCLRPVPTDSTSLPAPCRCEESYAGAHHIGVTRKLASKWKCIKAPGPTRPRPLGL